MITRLTCLVFAVVLVILALAEPAVGLAIVAAGITALVFLGLAARQPDTVPKGKSPAWPPWPTFSPVALSLASVAGGATVLAVALTVKDSYSAWAIGAWVGALACLIAAGPVQDRVTVAQAGGWLREPFAVRHRPELGTILAIAAVGLILRTYDLSQIPPLFHGDEGEMGLLARKILEGQRFPFFSSAPFQETAFLAHYLRAVSLKVFGPTVFGLRVLSVILGTLCIPVAYGLGRIGWGPAAGAIAAWFMAVGHLHVQYSRLGVPFIESPLLMSLMMLLFALVYERGRPTRGAEPPDAYEPGARGLWTLVTIAGILAGLAEYFHQGPRVVLIVAVACLVLLWRRGRIRPGHGAAFGFAFLVTCAPLLSHFIYRPDQFASHLWGTWSTSIVQPEYLHRVVGPDATMPSALPALLWYQLREGLGLLVRSSDDSGFYSGNIPVLDVVTASLFWLGLGAAIAHGRRYHEAALLLWLGLGVFFGGALTLGSLSGPRMVILLTPVYVLGGVFVTRLWQVLRATSLRQLDWLAVPVGTTLALWLLAANLATYFYDYAGRAENGESAAVAREVLVDSERYRVYFLTSPRFDPNHGSIKYIAYDIPVINLQAPDLADFTMPRDDGKGVLILALDHRRADLSKLEARFPGGTEQRVNAPNGRLMYISYRVPPRQ
ncbi:MAG: ArnT family glycosyltransferase [Chloroflexota bacterium]